MWRPDAATGSTIKIFPILVPKRTTTMLSHHRKKTAITSCWIGSGYVILQKRLQDIFIRVSASQLQLVAFGYFRTETRPLISTLYFNVENEEKIVWKHPKETTSGESDVGKFYERGAFFRVICSAPAKPLHSQPAPEIINFMKSSQRCFTCVFYHVT